ncbi:hypothetical protein Tco_0654592 [Tanacetum coccineum]|uniref:Uncharacterized protein n=1 Tax=Tanacetum coccineum TaxID=301880 RepID=A0ABQ4X422_9ASTR
MPTEMVAYTRTNLQWLVMEVSNIRVNSFTVKMEILLEPTSNKLMLERFLLQLEKPGQGRFFLIFLPVSQAILWIRRIRKDGGEGT